MNSEEDLKQRYLNYRAEDDSNGSIGHFLADQAQPYIEKHGSAEAWLNSGENVDQGALEEIFSKENRKRSNEPRNRSHLKTQLKKLDSLGIDLGISIKNNFSSVKDTSLLSTYRKMYGKFLRGESYSHKK